MVASTASAQSVTVGAGYRTDETGVVDVIGSAPSFKGVTAYAQMSFTGFEKPEIYPSLSIALINKKGVYLGFDNGAALLPTDETYKAFWWTGAFLTVNLPKSLVRTKGLALYSQFAALPTLKGSDPTVTIGIQKQIF